ncbi:MAG: aminotransferase class V-fold PLP-dependent enzyme [Hyphomicrobiaceae bacterium]
MNTKPRGRQFFFNPGPTNIPDRVLSAMHRPVIDFLSEEFLEIQDRVRAGLKRILKTKQHVLMYGANGHGAWEAAIVNLFSPGDTVLVIETGRFSKSWGQLATSAGLKIETLAADWRHGPAPDALQARLVEDKAHTIKGVLVVHNETSTGMAHPVAAYRKAIDAAKHPALYLVDTISSLASIDFRMDEWGVDVAVGGSQKGLMMVTGLSFTGISEKAFEAHKTAKLYRGYWDWQEMLSMKPQRFTGTSPVHLVCGLDEAIRILDEEGLDAVFARHSRLAKAVRACVTHWGGGAVADVRVDGGGFKGEVGALSLLSADPSRLSDSVTAILVPTGSSVDRLRKAALNRYNLSLGGGLDVLSGKAFRIGHMGDLNEPMVLGALATCELALRAADVPHAPGGVTAALDALADAA